MYHARALAATASTSISSASKGRRCRTRSRTTRASRFTASSPRRRFAASRAGLELRGRRACSTRCASAGGCGATLRTMQRPDLVLVQNPPAFPTLAVTWFCAASAGRALRDRLAQPRIHAAAAAARAVASGRAARALVRAARCAPRRREPVRVARPGGISREPVRRAERARALRSAGVGICADGTRRARTVPSGLFGTPGHSTAARSASSSARRAGPKTKTSTWSSKRCCGSRSAFAAGRRPAPARRFPDLVILVTGDGARRAEFERRFAGLPARRVQLRARWLEPEDYPRVVGSADLGLCLHRSSSGLDIPMKVADLFGAGVPVCALDYGACLAERVRHGDNGLLFSTARQLADMLFDLFETYPADNQRSTACAPARANRRGRHGRKGGRARRVRSFWTNRPRPAPGVNVSARPGVFRVTACPRNFYSLPDV